MTLLRLLVCLALGACRPSPKPAESETQPGHNEIPAKSDEVTAPAVQEQEPAEPKLVWRVPQAEGEPPARWILYPTGAAHSTGAGEPTGSWEDAGAVIRIYWKDGWREEIARSKEGFIKRSWAPGAEESAPPVDQSPIYRESETTARSD